MPEAFAVLAVFVVVIVAWVGAMLQSRNPKDPAEDLQRLRQHAAWLEQRLHVARRENWGDEMVAGIAEELRTTSGRLAAATARAQ